jgi:DNA-binding transcriptional ArsR family regulator
MTTIESHLLRAKEADELGHNLLDFARNLRAQSTVAKERGIFWPKSQTGIVDLATKLLELRQQRSKHLDAALCQDPAWNMLLALFQASPSGTEVSASTIRELSGAYDSTAVRWMAVLVDMGLVELGNMDGQDGEEWVRLTENGVFRMIGTITDMQNVLIAQLLPIEGQSRRNAVTWVREVRSFTDCWPSLSD